MCTCVDTGALDLELCDADNLQVCAMYDGAGTKAFYNFKVTLVVHGR